VSSAHHGDHRALLRRVRRTAATDAQVHAIIVPSARPASYIMAAADLARRLNCVLAVLCSKIAERRDIIASIERNRIIVDVVAADVSDVARLPLPRLLTSTILAGTEFERPTDTSAKRNLGLALSRMVGWANVVFLDDDIRVPNPADLRRSSLRGRRQWEPTGIMLPSRSRTAAARCTSTARRKARLQEQG